MNYGQNVKHLHLTQLAVLQQQSVHLVKNQVERFVHLTERQVLQFITLTEFVVGYVQIVDLLAY